MLDKFPYEILSEIFWNISIQDSRACAVAYDISEYHGTPISRLKDLIGEDSMYKIYTVCKERKSPDLYLAQHFQKSKELLTHMFIYDVWISGSRALDFFVPNSIDSQSDWDFYVEYKESKVKPFMEFMTSIGVTWLTPIEYVQKKIEASNNEVVLTVQEIRMCKGSLNSIHSNKIKVFVEELYYKYTDTAPGSNSYAHEYDIKSGFEKKVKIESETYRNNRIIRGVLLYKNKQSSIQLLLNPGSKITNLDQLRAFDLSIVQCAITGYMAFHMYSVDTYKNMSSSWMLYPPSKAKLSNMQKRINKYSSRGYKISKGSIYFAANATIDRKYISRHIGDPFSDVIVFEPKGNLNNKYKNYEGKIKLKRQIVYDYKWLEKSNELEPDIVYLSKPFNRKYFGCNCNEPRLIDCKCNDSIIQERTVDIFIPSYAI